MIRSVTYAALFDYPLTPAQVAESLPGMTANGTTVTRWWSASPALQAAIDWRDGYFVPSGRADLVGRRVRREAISHGVLARHRRALTVMAALPFVRMVALSGSLAHLNADENGDLDLFVVTAPGRVWLVTVAAIVVARLCGWRRRLCLNYVVSERALAVEPDDFFAANQILHLRPIAGEEVYRRFLHANPFIWDHYPNFEARSLQSWASLDRWAARARRPAEWLLAFVGAPAERLCRLAYGRHLRRRAATWQSRDQVRLEPECLKLHTSSHRADVLARFEAALAHALAPEQRRRTG
ncbi:MAG: hypothetical protein OEW19_04255 [Acidobacteriota bacterium]|nr:hypothetical protein [Acidobacteriota bacterium]